LQGLEDALPDPLLGPAAEALPGVVPVAEPLRQVAPGGAGLGDPQDGIEEQAVILGGDTGVSGFARKKVLDALPVLVGDRVAAAHDRASLANR
jgi:hypothetical protein